MAQIPDHIEIKLQQAEDFYPRTKEICLQYIEHPEEMLLKKISVYAGNTAQALRSALNNAMWDFAENRLKSVLPSEEYKKIGHSHDFPIENDTTSFEKKSRIIRHIASNHKDIYGFLERAQPYHKENESLLRVKILSNDTSHTIPVIVQYKDIISIGTVGFRKPEIRGNDVVVYLLDGLTIVHAIPCYVEELMMYVSSKKRWAIFLMSIDEGTMFSPTPFSKVASAQIRKLITEFYTLW